MYALHASVNHDVELYGLKVKSNQFKFLRRRIARQVDDSYLDELDDVDEVVDDAEVEEVDVVNDLKSSYQFGFIYGFGPI